MKGVLKIGEAQKNFMENSVTAKFYRIEKFCKLYCRDGICLKYYDVYEFYKVRNGNMYYAHHEENINSKGERIDGHNYKDVQLGYDEKAKEKGNKLYKELLNNGYKFAGIYESDICRYAKRIG